MLGCFSEYHGENQLHLSRESDYKRMGKDGAKENNVLAPLKNYLAYI